MPSLKGSHCRHQHWQQQQQHYSAAAGVVFQRVHNHCSIAASLRPQSRKCIGKGLSYSFVLLPQLGLDYSDLRQYLAAGDVRKADDETRALLIKMAGQGAVQRGWVYFTEVPTIPATDLQTVDALWRTASKNKFGYSVQKEMWIQVRLPGSGVLIMSVVHSCLRRGVRV